MGVHNILIHKYNTAYTGPWQISIVYVERNDKTVKVDIKITNPKKENVNIKYDYYYIIFISHILYCTHTTDTLYGVRRRYE